MKSIFFFFILSLIVLATPFNSNACVPAAAAPVFQTIDASSNAFIQVVNMPTGNVLRIIVTVPYTRINFNFCVTNVGTVPSGTNDGYATILDANSAQANELGDGDDGCSNVLGDGYGPPLFEFTFPSADTFYLYLTEYDPQGMDECFGNNGSNANFDADIDVILPPAFDAYPVANPLEYTQTPTSQIVPITLACEITNLGTTGDIVDLYVDVFKLPNTTTPVQSYSSLGNSIGAFSSLNETAGVYTPSTTGDYSVRYITTSVADLNAANDTAVATFKITNDIYARDQNAPDNIILAPGPDRLDIVQKFEFIAGGDIPGIYIGMLSDTSVFFNSDSIQLEVFAAVNDSPTTMLSSSTMMPLTAYTPNAISLIALPQTLMLQPGIYYFGVKFVQGSSRAGVATDGSIIPERATWGRGAVTSNMWVDLGSVIYVRPRVLPGTPVGINDALVNQLLLFPNPAKNQLYVFAPSPANEAATISLHSVDGRMVYNETIETNSNHSIDISSFAAGVYVVKFESNQTSITERVVIQ